MKNKLKLTLIILAALATGAVAQRLKPIYKVTRLSNTAVSVSCLDGSKLVGHTLGGDTLILECGGK